MKVREGCQPGRRAPPLARIFTVSPISAGRSALSEVQAEHRIEAILRRFSVRGDRNKISQNYIWFRLEHRNLFRERRNPPTEVLHKKQCPAVTSPKQTPERTPAGTTGLSFKDKATPIISIIALLISTSTFAIARLDARVVRAKEAAASELNQKGQNYKAYSLGQQVVRTFVFWFEVPKGEKDPQSLPRPESWAPSKSRNYSNWQICLTCEYPTLESCSLRQTQPTRSLTWIRRSRLRK
jgi:hypothetical protein